MGAGVWFYKMESVLRVDGGDGCVTVIVLNAAELYTENG